MAAPISPDENPRQHPDTTSSEDQGFIYDSSEVPQSETYYSPEREFVLMPLFRRIGELLGVRKHDADHIYVPEPTSPETQPTVAVEPDSVHAVEARSYPDAQEFLEPVQEVDFLQELESGAPAAAFIETPEDDVLGIEPQVASEFLLVQAEEAEREPEAPGFNETAPAEPVPMLESQPEPEVAVFWRATTAADEQNEAIAPQEVAPAERERIPVAAASAKTSLSQPAVRLLTQEDMKELVAPIREAAASISLAISQAAEWLRSKEEEILGRAETTAAAISQTEKTGPQLVEKRPQVPIWKRIDWQKEFTPVRAAILGALAMAILMVLGISLARRPASSILPQQQTRALQPGGVTLTTHPTATPAPVQAQRRPTTPVHPAASAPRRTHRQAADDGGPDVVTHYYGSKSKPSPVHQSTIAGVRHYSDMQ